MPRSAFDIPTDFSTAIRPGEGQGAVSEELGRLEGVGEAGRERRVAHRQRRRIVVVYPR
jgi:hypothetical protein